MYFFFFGFTKNSIKENIDSKKIIGTYIRNDGGTSGSEFSLKEDFTYRYYSWCDICPETEILGKWYLEDSLLILSDSLYIKYIHNFDNIKDTTITLINKNDTLVFKEIDNYYFLCRNIKLNQSLIEFIEKQRV